MGQVSLLDVFEAVQARISDIDTAAAKGAQVRSRVWWAEEGETSSRYFLRLEKKRGAENWIPAMKDPDGSIASRITDICDSWVSFYTNLFTACDTDLLVQSSLLDQLSLTLSPGLAGLCEGNISVSEAFSALKEFFDRVDWSFLLVVLRRMGFGPSLINWVKLLYTGVRSSVLINGYASNWFYPSRGVRQGCPLSPLLYVLSIEVLAAALRSHPDIVGLRLPGISTPLPVVSLYADDTSIISLSDRATTAVFEVYVKFEAGTGAKLNLSKCEGLWLGAWRNRPDPPVSILWSSDKIKTLGTFIGHGNLDEANWRPRIDAVERCLNSWRSRTLSYSGKALVIKSYCL